MEIAEDGSNKVHVAVGKSTNKAIDLLRWAFRKFERQEVCIVHVIRPSPDIPTPLGRLPASHANEVLVSAYRREEREQSGKLLMNYMSICTKANVKANVISVEAGQVHDGIVELVKKYGMKKLIMGAKPDDFTKVKKNISKAKYVAKNAPSFCDIWFINKGKHIWTREASEYQSFWPTKLTEDRTTQAGGLRLNQVSLTSVSGYTDKVLQSTSSSNSSTASEYTYSEIRGSPGSNSKVEESSFYNQMLEARREAEMSKNEAFAEFLKCRKLESESVEANNKILVIEAAHAHEVQLRKAAAYTLRTTRQEQEKLLKQTDEVARDLWATKRHVAVLESLINETNSRRNEAAGELSLIQMSLTTLGRDKMMILQEKEKFIYQIDQLKSESLTDDELRFFNISAEYTEFSLSDLQIATCNFGESFKIGQGEYGCVYKGEISDRRVAIKKLNPLKIKANMDFQQKVQVLSKVKHPNLVTLFGACTEAFALVYEYLPHRSLQDHLFLKISTHPLTWKIRTHIAADISSALLYLHSSKPEILFHMNLKPANIFLDSEFNSKIGDFGISQLVAEEIVCCSSLCGITETVDASPYKDFELPTTGHLTPKSDIYSFGVIILQLLTGRAPTVLVTEVRRAVQCGELASILDPSAGEWPTVVARRLAYFGLKCCELRSQDRPELTPTIVRELEQLHLAEAQTAPSFFLCPILQEIMHDPHVAADGFTYEGHAIRGWLKNRRGTSPMTNLKLSNLHLTPNHSLRFAIQDWLCLS